MTRESKLEQTKRNSELLLARITELDFDTRFSAIAKLASDVFEFAFGKTTDAARMKDILGEVLEFYRATTTKDRKGEYGDATTSLIVWSMEQEIDPVQYIKKTLSKIMSKQAMYAARGDKPNVAIFGLSADPPTWGHVSGARLVLNSPLGIVKVGFMPANEYFGSKVLTPAPIRAEMVKRLSQVDPRMDYMGYEIENELFSETINTMLKISCSEMAEHNRFYFLISVEVAIAMRNWPRVEELTRIVPFITIPRLGYPVDVTDLDKKARWFLQEPHEFINETTGLLEVSSSQVRRLYKERRYEEAEKLVPGPVHEFILEQGLYQ